MVWPYTHALLYFGYYLAAAVQQGQRPGINKIFASYLDFSRSAERREEVHRIGIKVHLIKGLHTGLTARYHHASIK